MEYIRVIRIVKGWEVSDVSMPITSEMLKNDVDTFKHEHDAKEVGGDDTFVHYLSVDGQSFLGVYHVSKH